MKIFITVMIIIGDDLKLKMAIEESKKASHEVNAMMFEKWLNYNKVL